MDGKIKKTNMRKSNYDKTPFTAVEGKLWKGWEDICGEIRRVCPTRPCGQTYVIRIECYQGVHHDELREAFLRSPRPYGLIPKGCSSRPGPYRK